MQATTVFFEAGNESIVARFLPGLTKAQYDLVCEILSYGFYAEELQQTLRAIACEWSATVEIWQSSVKRSFAPASVIPGFEESTDFTVKLREGVFRVLIAPPLEPAAVERLQVALVETPLRDQLLALTNHLVAFQRRERFIYRIFAPQELN